MLWRWSWQLWNKLPTNHKFNWIFILFLWNFHSYQPSTWLIDCTSFVLIFCDINSTPWDIVAKWHAVDNVLKIMSVDNAWFLWHLGHWLNRCWFGCKIRFQAFSDFRTFLNVLQHFRNVRSHSSVWSWAWEYFVQALLSPVNPEKRIFICLLI